MEYTMSKTSATLKQDWYGIERRILLLDLDFTLFDYSTVRKEVTKKVISSMNLNLDNDVAFRLYESISDHSRGLKSIGLPNFRHRWNAPELYALLIVLSRMNQRSAADFFKEISELEKRINEGNKIVHKPKIIATNPKTCKLLEEMRKIENDKTAQKTIKGAMMEFEFLTKKIPLFEEAEDFIRSLKNAGVEEYVVTEGDAKIQIEKHMKLGLQPLISTSKMLVVDQKTSDSFFRVIRAIQKNPDNPSGYLERYDTQKKVEAKKEPIKLAVIGDRYDKDIAPLIKLFGEDVITIRLLCGKYVHEYSGDYLKASGLPAPSLVTSSLSDAKTFLLTEDTWNRVKPIVLSNGRVKN